MKKTIVFTVFLMIMIFSIAAMPVFAQEDYPEIKGIYEGAPYADIATEHKTFWDPEERPEYYSISVTIPKEYIFDKDKLSGEVEMIIPSHWDGSEVVPESKVKVNNYIYIFKNSDKYFVKDMYEILNGVGSINYDRLKNELKNWLSMDAASMYNYPDFEIVSINGVPWQETEWADWIISETKRRLKPGDELLNNDLLWEIYVNPKYNGWAEEAYKQKLAILKSKAGTGDESPMEQQNTGENKELKGSKVELQLGSSKVYVYDQGSMKKTVTLNTAVKAPKGYTLIPLRGVLDELGANLAYDGSKHQITIETDKVSVKLVPGNKTAVVNGTKIEMQQPVVVENGRTMVPLRFVGEQLGYGVSYDPNTKKIIIVK